MSYHMYTAPCIRKETLLFFSNFLYMFVTILAQSFSLIGGYLDPLPVSLEGNFPGEFNKVQLRVQWSKKPSWIDVTRKLRGKLYSMLWNNWNTIANMVEFLLQNGVNNVHKALSIARKRNLDDIIWLLLEYMTLDRNGDVNMSGLELQSNKL